MLNWLKKARLQCRKYTRLYALETINFRFHCDKLSYGPYLFGIFNRRPEIGGPYFHNTFAIVPQYLLIEFIMHASVLDTSCYPRLYVTITLEQRNLTRQLYCWQKHLCSPEFEPRISKAGRRRVNLASEVVEKFKNTQNEYKTRLDNVSHRRRQMDRRWAGQWVKWNNGARLLPGALDSNATLLNPLT